MSRNFSKMLILNLLRKAPQMLADRCQASKKRAVNKMGNKWGVWCGPPPSTNSTTTTTNRTANPKKSAPKLPLSWPPTYLVVRYRTIWLLLKRLLSRRAKRTRKTYPKRNSEVIWRVLMTFQCCHLIELAQDCPLMKGIWPWWTKSNNPSKTPPTLWPMETWTMGPCHHPQGAEYP